MQASSQVRTIGLISHIRGSQANYEAASTDTAFAQLPRAERKEKKMDVAVRTQTYLSSAVFASCTSFCVQSPCAKTGCCDEDEPEGPAEELPATAAIRSSLSDRYVELSSRRKKGAWGLGRTRRLRKLPSRRTVGIFQFFPCQALIALSSLIGGSIPGRTATSGRHAVLFSPPLSVLCARPHICFDCAIFLY